MGSVEMSNLNEVIQLNNHRLLNGDATNKEDVDKLIGDCKVNLLLTDPPYGIDIVNTNKEGKSVEQNPQPSKVGIVRIPSKPGFKKNSKKDGVQTTYGKVGTPGIVNPRLYKPIVGDDKPFDPQHLLELNVPSIIFGANNFASKLPDNHKWLVWFKKPSLKFKRNNFSDVELCWTNIKGKSCLMYHHTWSGMVREGARKEELKERVHPTQKPVGLLVQMIEEFTKEGDTVLDLYGGSGSVLIACEKTNRKCLIMELSKDYCDIIEKRYWDYVGDSQTVLM